MRKSFAYPAARKLFEGNWRWILSQGYKYLAVKYLNRLWPDKVLAGPTMGIIVISYRCNSNCPMCYLAKRGNKTKELSTKEVERLIDEFAKINTSGVGFTGGEPLLRRDIFHLIDYVNKKRMVTSLNTNGLLLNNKMIEKLLDSQPDNINVSFDAADGRTYDRLRGTKMGLERLERIITQLVKRRNEKATPTTLTAVTTVVPGNISHLREIARLAKRLGFDKIGFNPLHNTSRSLKEKTIDCFSKELKGKNVYRLMKAVEKEKIKIDNTDKFLKMFNRAFKGEKFPLKCLAGHTSLFVDCFGDVYPCWPYVEMGKPAANIRGKGLSKLWQSESYAKIRKETRSCRDCFWNCQAELSILFN